MLYQTCLSEVMNKQSHSVLVVVKRVSHVCSVRFALV